jgi:hypothetical protein
MRPVSRRRRNGRDRVDRISGACARRPAFSRLAAARPQVIDGAATPAGAPDEVGMIGPM